MFTDITGKKRIKVGLHIHTTRSDGQKTPEEAVRLYEQAGYDMVALTDHWKYGEAYKTEKMIVLSGCEYNIEVYNEITGIYETFHIVGFGMQYDPEIPQNITCYGDHPTNINDCVREIVSKIRKSGGAAVLAHPAWSLNTPEQIMAAGNFDALEIYNAVSECGMSDRPYSGLLVDMLACQGIYYPLLATDDAHYYDGDACRGMIMAEADAVQELGIIGAVRAQRFYATQGPEIHLERIAEDQVKLICSPAVKIGFFSNLVWTAGRMVRGENLTEAVYQIKKEKHEKFIRAEVTDANGLMAWSNIIWLG